MTAKRAYIKSYDTIEFRASKLYSRDAVSFLKRQTDSLLSTKQAHLWLREITKIFPDSKLALSIEDLKIPPPLTRKRRRLLQKKSRLQNKQYEMLLSFTFNNK